MKYLLGSIIVTESDIIHATPSWLFLVMHFRFFIYINSDILLKNN